MDRLISPKKSVYCLYLSMISGLMSDSFGFFFSPFFFWITLLTFFKEGMFYSLEVFLSKLTLAMGSLQFSLRLGVSSVLVLLNGGNLVIVLGFPSVSISVCYIYMVFYIFDVVLRVERIAARHRFISRCFFRKDHVFDILNV